MMSQPWNVGILVFNEVEVLDFAGPFEVFSISRIPADNGEGEQKAFRVQTVSETGNLIKAVGGLQIQPDVSFETAPPFDLIVVPGGRGAFENEMHNEAVIAWVASQAQSVRRLTSVCTGALLLAKAGLLDGKNATTHWGGYDYFEEHFPLVKLDRGARFVDEGQLVTAAGVSAGIDMSLYLVKQIYGEAVAFTAAKRMVYDAKYL